MLYEQHKPNDETGGLEGRRS